MYLQRSLTSSERERQGYCIEGKSIVWQIATWKLGGVIEGLTTIECLVSLAIYIGSKICVWPPCNDGGWRICVGVEITFLLHPKHQCQSDHLFSLDFVTHIAKIKYLNIVGLKQLRIKRCAGQWPRELKFSRLRL